MKKWSCHKVKWCKWKCVHKIRKWNSDTLRKTLYLLDMVFVGLLYDMCGLQCHNNSVFSIKSGIFLVRRLFYAFLIYFLGIKKFVFGFYVRFTANPLYLKLRKQIASFGIAVFERLCYKAGYLNSFFARTTAHHRLSLGIGFGRR